MKISVIGAGAMGGSMVQGLLKGETFKASDITVADPYQGSLDRLSDSGASLTTDNKAAAVDADIVTVVVKPWLVEGVLNEIKSVMDYQSQILIVIAAGVSSQQISEWLDKGDGALPSIFLVIPNIAIAVMSSMTFIVPVKHQKSRLGSCRACSMRWAVPSSRKSVCCQPARHSHPVASLMP
jgi:pyrroline-5-carboxylate reductase